ncbi:hypothetical protein JCM30471_12280 [Desulfuromonas carbonis]
MVLVVIPFIRSGDQSLLRLDIPTLSLQLFGSTLHLEELYLFLLLALSLIFLFLLVTLAFGRAWCGWACPQTTLSDLSEGLARRLGLELEQGGFSGAPWRRGLLHLLLILLALLVGANLVWYFISPYSFFPRLFTLSLPLGAVISLLGTALIVYLDLVWLRRLFCQEFCPYGRFQTVLVDSGTLTLRYHPDHADRCIQCGACVRACPMKIDIRRGYQVECINCGRCLDACREVMARRGQSGIIRYTFGVDGNGFAALLNLRMLLVGAAFILLSAVLVVATLNRPLATLKLARAGNIAPRALEDGRVATMFTTVIANRGAAPLSLTLSAHDDKGHTLELRGPTEQLQVQPNERRQLSILLLAPAAPQRQAVDFRLSNSQGEPLASSRAYLDPLPGSH